MTAQSLPALGSTKEQASSKYLIAAMALGAVYFLLSFLCPADRVLAQVGLSSSVDLGLAGLLSIGALLKAQVKPSKHMLLKKSPPQEGFYNFRRRTGI